MDLEQNIIKSFINTNKDKEGDCFHEQLYGANNQKSFLSDGILDHEKKCDWFYNQGWEYRSLEKRKINPFLFADSKMC